jgi:hypothetical protein
MPLAFGLGVAAWQLGCALYLAPRQACEGRSEPEGQGGPEDERMTIGPKQLRRASGDGTEARRLRDARRGGSWTVIQVQPLGASAEAGWSAFVREGRSLTIE